MRTVVLYMEGCYTSSSKWLLYSVIPSSHPFDRVYQYLSYSPSIRYGSIDLPLDELLNGSRCPCLPRLTL